MFGSYLHIFLWLNPIFVWLNRTVKKKQRSKSLVKPFKPESHQLPVPGVVKFRQLVVLVSAGTNIAGRGRCRQ